MRHYFLYGSPVNDSGLLLLFLAFIKIIIMKKKTLNLGKLGLKKSKVATFESNSVTGGFQSWTGTAEPCLSEFDCDTDDCGTHNCGTNNCGTNNCGTNNCGTNYCQTQNNCGTALFSACEGMNCY